MTSHPAYLITGDDELLVQRATERLLADLSKELGAPDITWCDVGETARLPELRTTSLFDQRRVVVIRGAERLSGDLATDIDTYLDDPAARSVLVISARGIGKIQRIAKKAAAAGQKIEANAPKPWADREWKALAKDEFGRHGTKPNATTIAALVELTGTDPARIASAVSQVVAATPAGQDVTEATVRATVRGAASTTSFAVADAVADRNPARAVAAAREALEVGEQPMAILGALTFRMRQLLQARAGATAKEMRASPAQVRRLGGVARAFQPGELAWCHERLARLDVQLKSSDLPADLVLEVAVVELSTPGYFIEAPEPVAAYVPPPP